MSAGVGIGLRIPNHSHTRAGVCQIEIVAAGMWMWKIVDVLWLWVPGRKSGTYHGPPPNRNRLSRAPPAFSPLERKINTHVGYCDYIGSFLISGRRRFEKRVSAL